MKKRLFVLLLLVCMLISTYLVTVKPLQIGAIGTADHQKVALLEVGNTGFLPLKVLNITINHHIEPTTEKLQVQKATEALLIGDKDDMHSDAFLPIYTPVPKRTSLDDMYEKLDRHETTASDRIYGLSMASAEAIHHVTIQYKYFGMTKSKTVEVGGM